MVTLRLNGIVGRQIGIYANLLAVLSCDLLNNADENALGDSPSFNMVFFRGESVFNELERSAR